jgi:DNA-binding transcriptional MerR regulator
MSDSELPRPMRPAQLAALAGVSTDTLRYYERRGLLLSKRSPNGYRAYPPDALERVRLVRRALSVGFSLDELARVVRVRDRGGVPCREARALAAAKLASMEAQVRELQALRDGLRRLLKQWDERLAKTPAGKQARLLQSLASSAEGAASLGLVSERPAVRLRKRKNADRKHEDPA